MPPLSVLLGVAGGGALGSLLRFAVGRALPTAPGAMPWSTIGINVLGSFALGLLAGATFARPDASPALRAFLSVGLLGGFTTFSAFAFESLGFGLDGAWTRLVLNVSAQLLLGLGAAWAGYGIGRAL